MQIVHTPFRSKDHTDSTQIENAYPADYTDLADQ